MDSPFSTIEKGNKSLVPLIRAAKWYISLNKKYWSNSGEYKK